MFHQGGKQWLTMEEAAIELKYNIVASLVRWLNNHPNIDRDPEYVLKRKYKKGYARAISREGITKINNVRDSFRGNQHRKPLKAVTVLLHEGKEKVADMAISHFKEKNNLLPGTPKKYPMLEFFPEPKVAVPERSITSYINQLVDIRHKETGQSHEMVWIDLYTEMLHRSGINFRQQAKNQKIKPTIRLVEKMGYIHDLYALAKYLFAPKEM